MGVKEYIQDLLENDIKFIVFAHHLDIMDEIETYITQLKVKSIRIDGSVNIEARHERV